MTKHNWQVIEAQYVEAPSDAERPTLDELAAKYGCSPSYLREKAAKDEWKVKAARFLETVQEKRQEHKTELIAGDLAQWDADCFKIAKVLLAQGFGHLKKAMQPDGEPLDPKTLDGLARMMERVHKLGRAALGEDKGLSLSLDMSQMSDEQLSRLADGEDPRNVISN